ncbi:hypothetical protein TYRP_017294 [Tyrophagus putrescentiae]|nr:hypothetical protein TYRP_017294 [Tyrophagus putrescentiae]
MSKEALTLDHLKEGVHKAGGLIAEEDVQLLETLLSKGLLLVLAGAGGGRFLNQRKDVLGEDQWPSASAAEQRLRQRKATEKKRASK